MLKTTGVKLFKYLKKDIFILIITVLLSILTVGTTIYIPILFGQAIDTIIEINNVDFDKLKEILSLVIIIVGITSVCEWIMRILNNKMTYRISKRLRQDAFRKIQKLPFSYLDQKQTGELVNIIINDVEQLTDGLLLGFTQAFTSLMTIIGTLILMLLINWLIAIVVIVLTPLSLFMARFITSKTHKFFVDQTKIKGTQTGFINEMISNLKTVQAYNHQDENLDHFNQINNELEKTSLKAIFFSSLTNPCTRFVNSVVYALVALFGSLFVINPVFNLTLSIGLLSTFLSYANQYTKPFNEISSVISELHNAFICANRVFTILDEQEEIINNNEIKLDSIHGDIEIKDVFFSYTKEQRLIENFNLSVSKGQKVAIVGPTGCGKTTLINLLMRFYDVNKGGIYLDNQNIQNLNRQNLRDFYGMVLQETWIKHASVKDNITIGKPDATLEEVIEACKKTHAHSFIKRLPNGYDTIISNEGNLSAGQKQLLCISRVMLLLPPMLILDEATSSIDTRTELKIQDAFNTLMKNKTSFIVAHRLSTIKEADLILVMNKGQIIEQGTHEELLKKGGFYYNLYNSQFEK